MQITDWSFLAVVITILLTPGPTNTLLAAAGATSGWQTGKRLVLMECLGYWLATSVWGFLLVGLLLEYPLLLNLTKLVSAIYIAKLGMDMLRGAMLQPDTANSHYTVTTKRLFWATLLNPKAAIFATVIFPAATWEGALAYMAVLTSFLASVALVGCAWIVFGAALITGKVSWLTPERFKRFAAFMLFGFSGWLSFNGFFR